MNTISPRRARLRRAVTGLLVVLAVIAAAVLGTLVYRSAYAAPASPADSAALDGAVDETSDGRVTEADGILPAAASPFDEQYAGIAHLSPDLLAALREATKDAAAQGVTVHVNSGWRSAEYQAQLLRDAVSQYGSEAEAARWVATPATSAHVAGDAVDVGPYAAAAWMMAHGQRYGLCQTYDNEAWHYELRPEAIDAGCPASYRDPTQDPRMQG